MTTARKPMPSKKKLPIQKADVELRCEAIPIGCGRLLPRENFPPTSLKTGTMLCTECWETLGHRLTILKTAHKRRALMENAVTSASARKINAPHISELTENMVDKFGGMDGFVELWTGQIHQAMNEGKTKLALDACANIMRLISLSTKHRQSAPDVNSMGDEDIQAELLRLSDRILINEERRDTA